MKKANLLLLTALAACIPQFGARAQTLTCDGAEGLLSFEEGPAPARADRNGRADISGVHYKLGVRSLRWDWKAPGAKLAFDVAVPYRKENPDPKETSISSFSFWVYSPKALQGSLTVAFEKAGRECCRFEFRLGFQGWRGAWVAFDRDMQGTPAEGMDRIVITGPALRKGTLYFDGVLPAVFLDSRHHTPDFQLPAVNEGTTSHWLLLYKSWNRQLDIALYEYLVCWLSDLNKPIGQNGGKWFRTGRSQFQH